MDDHWRPIYTMCSVCQENLQYDVIIKFENLDTEERYNKNILFRLVNQCEINYIPLSPIPPSVLKWDILIFTFSSFFAPEVYILEAPFLHCWDFTLFVATASMFKTGMVTQVA